MAYCIDCLHFDICQFNEQEQAVINLKPSYRDISNDIADGCKFFKNKADFVEVVRCKECKHYTNIDTYRNPPRLDFHWCNKLGNVTKENDYCSYGERRCED